MSAYRYLGDRYTRPELKGQPCEAVRRDGKCIRGRSGNMLVRFAGGACVVDAALAAEAQLGGVLTAISGADLFAEPRPEGEDTREPVGVLYDRAGNEVRLGALRPKSTSEAVKALAMLEGILERGYDKIRELREFGGVSDNERREIEAAVTRRFFAHVTEKWGEEMARDLLNDFIEAEGVRVAGQSVVTQDGEEDDE